MAESGLFKEVGLVVGYCYHLQTVFTNFCAELSQDQQDKIKQKLEKANANAQAGRIQEPAPGTLKWLSTDDKYTAWLRSTDSEILAVLGDAGTGKSVLSAHIFYELDRRYQPRENNLILHYFIDESTSNQGDAEVLLLQALMSQVLSEHGEALAEMPSSRFNSFISERPDALMGAFGELISKTRVEYLFIIIDALDECDSGAQAKILARLATMSLLQTVIATRVYVSCRSTTPAAHALENFPDERPRVKLLRIMQDKLREDINAVVNAMIDRFIKIGIIAEVHRSRLAELLVSRAEDTFIWLAAAGPVLEEDAGLSYAELETLVDTLPPQLENLYESRLLRFSEKNRKLVGNIFKAIRESFRKLTSQEVNFLISMPEKQKSRPEKQKSVAAIREGCKIKDGGIGLTKLTKHLVTVDKDDHVSFMHSTLKDALKAFSERDMTPDMRLFQANEVDCHRFLAEQCMRFLLLTGFEDYAPKVEEDGDYGLGTLFLTTPARDFGEIPLFEYAANNWWKHLRVDSLILEEELYKMGLSLVSSSDKQPPVWCQYLQAVSQGPQSFPERATPLNLACYCGFPKMLESEEFSPEGLFWAARNNNLDCVQALLRKDNIRLDWLKNEYLQSSLYAAAEGGHLATFRVLLKAGASAAINQCNSTLGSGETPLMIAAAGGHVEMIIEILALEHADPDVEDRNGKTAIFFANTKDILETILKHSRAKVHHVDQAGRNVLSHACSYGEIDIARLLIKENLVDINAADNLGMTPLIRAVRANELAMVHLLLDNNRIDINKRDHKEGRNAISWAASLSRFEILEALCAKDPSGASVEDDGGWFPLEWTIYPTQNLKNATLLLEHSGREFHGRKGLKFFTDTFKYQAGQIAKELISKRVFDINTESSDGRTALSYACEQGSPSLVKLILETPGINTRLMGNMKEHLDEMLTERERTRDSEITSKIRTLVHEKLN
jgi:ankyrin repeat protein